MVAHWERLESLLGAPIRYIRARLDLDGLIREFGALPNFRMRWCTRMLKIEPCAAFLRSLDSPVLHVGLRADEPERQGVAYAGSTERYPLREWGWGLAEVVGYLRDRGVVVPARTDCARCYHQRIGEWWELWRNHPDRWASAEAQEIELGHTFRTPGRDSWPTSLAELRAEFERGAIPGGTRRQLDLFSGDAPCRVCSL